jgi:hypothetical protein
VGLIRSGSLSMTGFGISGVNFNLGYPVMFVCINRSYPPSSVQVFITVCQRITRLYVSTTKWSSSGHKRT